MDTTTGMSPPPIEATRWTPSASAMTVTAMSTPSVGAMTNHTVSTANATSAPMFSRFLPGSTSGADLNRAESLPHATIEPVKVTAPMNTPMTTSAWWMPSSVGSSLSPIASSRPRPSTSR